MLGTVAKILSEKWQRLLPAGSARRSKFTAHSALGRGRLLRAEPLEPRLVLSAPGLVEVGAQPVGPLTGKIVYTSAGHGWQWNNTLNRFATDRGDNNEIVEDFGNQDQLTYYADYLLRAGATVVPMRPIGRQINEVVLDNDSPSVTYTGSWSNSTSGARWYDEDYGAVADSVRYRFANVNGSSETATATYTPNIPQSGFYPVYTWVSHGSNRTSQLYKINYSGGQTEIRVDHRMVGNGWVYLGTYHFDAGSSAANGSVQISNFSTAGGSVVIADAIRFGNGMGDVPSGPGGIGTGSVSGYPREDENSLHWLWRGVGLGVTPSSVLGTSNVSAPANMAEHMNANTNPFGTSVYIGFHSNATTGDPNTATARGAIGLMTTDASLRTPNQQSLATFTARQINVDMRALDGNFEHNWSTRTNYVGSNQNFGEINKNRFTNSSGVVEMDATIIETAFHDTTVDAQLMRDPRVRDQLARSTYEATLEYFNNFGGVATTTTLPSAPNNVRAVSNAEGAVTVSWAAGPTGVYGHAATGFRIYASVNGYGFDGGTFVAGGGTNSATLTGYDPTLPYYFKVVAENAGGQSLASEVITVLPSGGEKQVLIVNGFDRNDRTQNFRYPYAFTSDGLVDRVWSRYNNSFDYVVQVHSAIHAARPGVHVASTSNEAVISGAVNLTDYEAVIWILGNESTANSTFNATEQSKVTQFITGGGHFFVTGSEIAWDLDQQNNGRAFFENTLKGNYVGDSANTYTVSTAAGGIFAGIPNLTFSNGAQFSNLTSQMYNVSSADRISPQAGAVTAMSYVGGTGGGAAIQVTGVGGSGNIVMFGFPFETITSANLRRDVMERVLDFFQVTVGNPVTIEYILDNDNLAPTYTESGTWSLSANVGYNGGTYKFASVGNPSQATWSTFVPIAGQAEVFVIYATGVGRPTNATYTVDTGNGSANASVNQTINDLQWVSLGTFDFAAGTRSVTLNAQTSSGGSFAIADAVRIVLTGERTDVGDFNSDGVVDSKDYLVWLQNTGTASGATLQMGDGNFDGRVDRADLAIWQAQFGLIGPPPSGGAGSVAAFAASEPALGDTFAETKTEGGWWPAVGPHFGENRGRSKSAPLDRNQEQEPSRQRRAMLLPSLDFPPAAHQIPDRESEEPIRGKARDGAFEELGDFLGLHFSRIRDGIAQKRESVAQD